MTLVRLLDQPCPLVAQLAQTPLEGRGGCIGVVAVRPIAAAVGGRGGGRYAASVGQDVIDARLVALDLLLQGLRNGQVTGGAEVTVVFIKKLRTKLEHDVYCPGEISE